MTDRRAKSLFWLVVEAALKCGLLRGWNAGETPHRLIQARWKEATPNGIGTVRGLPAGKCANVKPAEEAHKSHPAPGVGVLAHFGPFLVVKITIPTEIDKLFGTQQILSYHPTTLKNPSLRLTLSFSGIVNSSIRSSAFCTVLGAVRPDESSFQSLRALNFPKRLPCPSRSIK